MTYEQTIIVSKEKSMLFNHIMNDNIKETDDAAIELPLAILDATFPDKTRIIVSLAGTMSGESNSLWIESSLFDKNNMLLVKNAPQTTLFDTFVIQNEGNEYTLTIKEETHL